MVSRFVEIVPYNQNWPMMALDEIDILRSIFEDSAISFNHIGSTAVPGMSSKPIIDLIVELRSLIKFDLVKRKLEAIGYLSRGDNGISGRQYFIKFDATKTVRRFHLHCFEHGHIEISNYLRFRDALIKYRCFAAEYEKVKICSAKKVNGISSSYQNEKSKWIREFIGKLNTDRDLNEM